MDGHVKHAAYEATYGYTSAMYTTVAVVPSSNGALAACFLGKEH
jgi:hypothetical protein